MVENEKTLKMLNIAHEALDDKLAVDIKVLDIHEVSVLADYFIIANGNNPNHVQALIDSVEENLSKEGFEPKHIEGHKNGSWILLDYGDIVVHIFGKEDRYFYDLERMWSDGKEIDMKKN